MLHAPTHCAKGTVPWQHSTAGLMTHVDATALDVQKLTRRYQIVKHRTPDQLVFAYATSINTW